MNGARRLRTCAICRKLDVRGARVAPPPAPGHSPSSRTSPAARSLKTVRDHESMAGAAQINRVPPCLPLVIHLILKAVDRRIGVGRACAELVEVLLQPVF